MKLLVFFLLLCSTTFAQNIDFETEKNIIKETLSQYFNDNPNSVASYLKGSKGFKMATFGLKMGIAMEEDEAKKNDLIKNLKEFDAYSDSLVDVLKTKKINVQLSDTLYAYKYVIGSSNLQKKEDWQAAYNFLLDDFEKNDLARLDTIIGKAYIDLIKKQIDYKGTDKIIQRNELNHGYYQYTDASKPCEDELCIKADKVYRAVFNSTGTKGCYLVSFYCRNGICRSFVFIEKVNNQWKYVDDYPSWLVDDL